MKRFLIRLASLVAVLLIVTVAITYMVDQLPGDPARAILGEDATPEQVAQVREELRLDEPFLVRYGLWLSDALQGDFGTSLRTKEQVSEAIVNRFPVSLELMILAQLIAIAVAVPLAIYGAYRRGGVVDRASSTFSFMCISIAPFMTAIILSYIVAVQLKWVPASGFVPLEEGLWANLRTVILPSLALALVPLGVYQRILRSDLAQTMDEDFILAAQAKGMGPVNIMLRQALRPSSLGILTLAGINTAALIGGSIVIESIFALPGLGQLMVQSIGSRDIVTLQALVLLIALVYVLINAVIDGLYRVVDPRVGHEH